MIPEESFTFLPSKELVSRCLCRSCAVCSSCICQHRQLCSCGSQRLNETLSACWDRSKRAFISSGVSQNAFWLQRCDRQVCPETLRQQRPYQAKLVSLQTSLLLNQLVFWWLNTKLKLGWCKNKYTPLKVSGAKLHFRLQMSNLTRIN